MEYRLIGFVNRSGGTPMIDESFNAANEAAADKVAKELIKKAEDYPTHRSSTFELCVPVRKYGKDRAIFFQSLYGKSK